MKANYKKINPFFPITFSVLLMVSIGSCFNASQADSIKVENSVNSYSNSGEKKTDNDNTRTGEAKSESKTEVNVNENSEGEIEIESKSQANELESEIKLKEEIKNLPPEFSKEEFQQEGDSQVKTETNIKKEGDFSKEEPGDSLKSFSKIKKNLSLLIKNIASKVSSLLF
ncbi:MAG: hypothetical protein R6V40_00065 [Candidatus Moraniibacteriota bacterium]